MKHKFNSAIKTPLTLSACALAVWALTSMPAMAEGIDLKVTGTIIPAACKASISGEIDYGYVTAAQLDATAYTVLDKQEVQFAIACDGPVKVAIKAINGQPGTVAGAVEGGAQSTAVSPVDLLGLGRTRVVGLGAEGESNIGGYAVGLVAEGLEADSEDMQVLHRYNISTGWYAQNKAITNVYAEGGLVVNAISWRPAGGSGPQAISNLKGTLAVQAYLNNTTDLKVDKAIQLNGLTTIELVYL